MKRIDAIQILEEHLYDGYTADPLLEGEFVVNRPSISEYELFWCMLSSKIELMFKEDYFPALGGYYYLVDKKTGNIYTSPSNVEIDWIQDFHKFLSKEDHRVDWNKLEAKIYYLDNILEEVYYESYEEHNYRLKVDGWENQILNNIKDLLKKINTKQINVVKIRYRAIDGVVCDCKVEFKRKDNSYEIGNKINVLSRKYNGKLKYFFRELTPLKKWIRVFEKKSTDNYWIEINIDDLVKDNIKLEYYCKIEYK